MHLDNLISNQQLCFLHIPKTAGVTLAFYLDQLFSADEICPAKDMYDMEKMPKGSLSRCRFLRGHFCYDICEHLPQKPAFITILRDPIDRVISHYEYWKSYSTKWPTSDPDPNLASKYEEHRAAVSRDLLYFVTGNHPRAAWLANLQTWKVASGDINKWPDTTDRRLIELAKEHLEEFAFVGITELFSESLLLLSYKLGFEPPKSVLRLNVTPTRTQRGHIPSKTLEAIIERNQLDLELYEYAQQIFRARFQSCFGELRSE